MRPPQLPSRHDLAARIKARQRAIHTLPDVHPALAGFDVRLNAFGEVDMTISIDELNDFLDREVDDPKLRQWEFEEE